MDHIRIMERFEKEFIDKGMHLIRYRFDLGEIEELSSQRQLHRSWWKFLRRSEVRMHR
jgi:hypothetical protein